MNMASETTTTTVPFSATDLEVVGVKLDGFRTEDPENPGQDVLAIRVQYVGMTGYLFPWNDSYDEGFDGPVEVVRADVVRALKELIGRVESNNTTPAEDVNVH